MDELIETFLEEYTGAREELEKGRFKNAAILYAKALFALCDLLIQAELGKLPKNHTERFRILEEYFPEAYHVVDQAFVHYTDAYSKPVLRQTCTTIHDGITKISRHPRTPPEIKGIIK